MKLTEYSEAFARFDTPFYFYNMDILDNTLRTYMKLLTRYGYKAHYALKANANPRILEIILRSGFGADCVSGNEVRLALDMGFGPENIVFAGVGKTDKEIQTALQNDLFSINCESIPEIQVVNAQAAQMGKKACISLRLNPNIDAHTHQKITTGRSKDKFGISEWMLPEVMEVLKDSKNLKIKGLHFHVGSQVTNMSVFETVCEKANEFQSWFEQHGYSCEYINLGGGLGIDYNDPLEHPLAPFDTYFETLHKHLEVRKGQKVHLEPGRSLVGQCGFLISRVLFVKIGRGKKFAIIDAGMNDLIRPALYGAQHAIVNLTSTGKPVHYDVVGPVCESSDRFGRSVSLAACRRGDLLAICSAGAYGQVMAMRYNLRDLAPAVYSTDI